MVPKDKLISNFSKSFVCAGPRQNIIAIFNEMIENGVQGSEDSRNKILATQSEKKRLALFCDIVNDGHKKYGAYPRVKVVDHVWWKASYGTMPSYGVPRQIKQIAKECLVFKDMETLIPE